MRCIAAAALLLAAAVTACRSAENGDAAEIRIIRLPSFAVGSEETRFGELDFLGGIQIVTSDRRFGGLSGIALLEDGVSALMVSDNGYLVSGRLEHEGGRLAGLSQLAVRPILPGAERVDPKFDVEDIALAADGQSGYLAVEWSLTPVIAFMRRGEVFTETGRLAIAGADPRILDSNQGIESIAVVPETSPVHAGELLAIAEHPGPGDDFIRGWFHSGGLISIARNDGYDVSSARFLPNGDLVLLERRFGPAWGVGMRLRRITASDIAAGGLLTGSTMLEAGLGEQIDNMEGLAVSRGPDGRTVLTLVSDDNTSILQRTLVLQFAIVE